MVKKLNTAEFKKIIYDLFQDEYTVVGEYKTNDTKIEMIHNKCGKTFYKRPVKMIHPPYEGCYFCSGKNRYRTTESFQKEVDEKYPDEFKIVGEYKRSREKLEVHRIPCGHNYLVTPDNLLRGKGCPKCTIRQSSYMDLTENILNKHNVEFIKEKRFEDCKSERVLPFDYYLPKYNVCIEVDGEFHYMQGIYNHECGKLEAVQKRDGIKTEYCKTNNIPLLRLPYFEKDNFESLILQFIHENTEVTC